MGDINDDAFINSDYLIITGCSDNHLNSTINLLYSIVYTDKNASIVFVDYGISDENIQILVKELTFIHQIHMNLQSHAQLFYRKFNFRNFPEWWSIKDRKVRGAYSWKVVSYFDVLNQTKRIINWTDGGSLWRGKFFTDKSRAIEHGIFTPYAYDSLVRWAHWLSNKFLIDNKMVTKIFLGKGLCTAGYVWFDYRNQTIMDTIVKPLLQCAYTRKCISPYKTSRANHRQDQAILSAMVHSMRLTNSCNSNYRTSVEFHQDCKTNCQSIRNAMLMNIKKKYGDQSLFKVMI